MLEPVNKYKRYADYYEVFYRDKNYLKESDYIEEVFKKHAREPVKTVLDLGCGMGSHSLILSKRGYQLTGIDLSKKLIEIAKKKAAEKNLKADFMTGDLRELNLNKKFDAVIAMFNVIGFQVRDEDFRAAIKTAHCHLKEKGLFVFDCWFGPAVLSQKPENWLKTIEKDNERIIKFTKPTLDLKNKVIKLEYKVFRISGDRILDEFNERHTLRFFFPEEIKQFLEKENFKILKIAPFLELDKNPTVNDWNITVISQKL
jgi:SAM-dependent methyltransferase